MHENSHNSKLIEGIERATSIPSVALSSSIPSSQHQSASIRRRSLNISHFNALQNAVSNLARIDDFHLEELGYGFFSDVFKATHKQSGKVMVLKRNKTTNTKMNILREVQLMNRLSHPHILKFKGVCVHEGQLHALTEFINGGDLDQLVTRKNVVLTWKQRIQLALDVAKGMSYLHSVGVFHRDLTAKNCLVRVTVGEKGNKEYTCIVADLGLAEKIPTCAKGEERLAMVGTPYSMAPEVLKGKPYNEKADIFSFGLLVCQLIALVSVDPEELPRSSDFGLARDLFDKMVNEPIRANACHDTSSPLPDDFLQLAYDCCQLNPECRPSFKEIVTRLQDISISVKCNHVETASAYRVHKHTDVLHSLSKENGKKASNGQETIATKVESSLETQHSHIDASDTEKKRRSSSGLSRSFSHISRELLSHFSNMIDSSSSNSDCDIAGKKDTYSNPFASLQYLEGGQMKITDKPSLALLEMTFDLTTSDGLKTSWNRQCNSLKKPRRSKSIYAVNLQGDHDSSKPSPSSPRRLSPIYSSPVCKMVPFRSKAFFQEPSNSVSSECEDCNYQRALHRAMVLSPLGNNLASWWCRRKQGTPRPRARSERHSLATVMSLLSKNNHTIPRSISLPDMSCKAILFHFPADESIGKCPSIPFRTKRSKTSDVVFSLDQKQEAITEETEDDVLIDDDSFVHASTDAHALFQSKSPSDMKSKEITRLTCNSSMHACSDNAITHFSFNNLSKQEASLNNLLQGDRITEKKGERAGKVHGVECVQVHGDDVKGSGDAHVPHSASCSSSSSSGCSTSSLLITMQTGEMTQRKRISNQGRARRSSVYSTDKLNNNFSALHRNHDDVTGDASVNSNNRDSGYEEDNLNPVASPNSEYRNQHVTWVIPE